MEPGTFALPEADDASTGIEQKVRAFAADLTNRLHGMRFADGKVEAGDLRLELDRGSGSVARTPRQQAEFVSQGRSWVCWGAHMSDRARHVRVTYKGRYVANPEVLLGRQFSVFTGLWGLAMRRHGLKNYRSGDGWGSGDGYHLQLPDAMIPRTHERAQACLQEYVRMTVLEKKPKNEKFEKRYQKDLAPHVERLRTAPRGAPPASPPPAAPPAPGPQQRMT